MTRLYTSRRRFVSQGYETPANVVISPEARDCQHIIAANPHPIFLLNLKICYNRGLRRITQIVFSHPCNPTKSAVL